MEAEEGVLTVHAKPLLVALVGLLRQRGWFERAYRVALHLGCGLLGEEHG